MTTQDTADHAHGHGHGHEHGEHGPEGPEHEHDHGEEERLRDVLRERFIEIRSLSPELKVLTLLSAAALVTLAVLSLLRNDLIGHLVTDTYFSLNGDENASMSQVVFVVSVVFVCAGWAMVTTAAARAGWTTRIATGAALGIAFGTERTGATYLNLATTVEASALCAVIILVLVVTWFPERRVYDETDARAISAGSAWRVLRKGVFPFTFLVYLGLYALIWHESNTNGFPANFVESVADQLSNIQWLLIPIITLAGADFGDWGNFAVGRLTRRIRSSVPTPVFVLVVLAACGGVIWHGMRYAYVQGQQYYGGGLTPELIMGGMTFLIAGVLIVAARPRSGWPRSYSYFALVLVASLDSLVLFVLSEVTDNVDHQNGWEAITWLVLGGLSLITALVMRGRLPGWAVTSMVFVAMIGVIYMFAYADEVESVWKVFGYHPYNSPYLGFEGLMAVSGCITVLVLLIALVSRRLSAWMEPIVMLLRLSVTFQVLQWIDWLYGGAVSKAGAAKTAGQISLAAAVVLVLALSWEFATSGESVTNNHNRKFPRDSRVMIFLGYIVITATDSVFYSNIGQKVGGKWTLLESQFEAEAYVRDALLFLGAPLALTIFIIAFSRWREQRPRPSAGEEPLPTALARQPG